MERILINGVEVEVPKEIVAEGRAAVAAWHAAQLAAAGLPPEPVADDPKPRRRGREEG